MTFRILITGSRDWEDEEVIMGALDEYAGAEDVVLVHGACPTGADAIAAKYAERLGFTVEPHPAQWNRFKKQAGYMRNVEMVMAGADICLAFIKDQSRGSTHCAQYARMAHIKTLVYTQSGEFFDGRFTYCTEVLTFGEVYLHCDKEASDRHTEHEGSGTDDEGKLYLMSWKD